MGKTNADRSFKLDYACDGAQYYLEQLRNTGAQFYSGNRYQIMHLNGRVTELSRVSDTLRTLDVHLGLKNLWRDRDIAGKLWVQVSPLKRESNFS
jgi:hypothetical protein